MSVSIDFSGKTVLITGASRGIGAEMARVFHRAGASVVINHPDFGDTAPDAEEIAQELNSVREGSAFVCAADISDADAVKSMMEGIQSDRGGIDFLVNNAAIIRDRTMAKMDLSEWQQVIDVNLSGVFYCCKFGLEIMNSQWFWLSLAAVLISAYYPMLWCRMLCPTGAVLDGIVFMAKSNPAKRRTQDIGQVSPGAVGQPAGA